MSPITALCSFVLIAAGNVVALSVLKQASCSRWQREIQLYVLASPAISLFLALTSLHGCAGGSFCLPEGPSVVAMALGILLLVVGSLAVGAVGLGLARLILLVHLVRRPALPPSPELQQRADDLAKRLGISPPHLLLHWSDRPLALTYGIVRPTALLSTWMVEYLDADELEAVLAHELGHAARHDFLIGWIATLLRDAFCYLPTSWEAHRRLMHEREVACDDLAIRVTHRPLRLASALAKVWHEAVRKPSFALAPTLAAPHEALEGRITRLLAQARAVDEAAADGIGHRDKSLSLPRLLALLALSGFGVALILGVMGCGPVVLGA